MQGHARGRKKVFLVTILNHIGKNIYMYTTLDNAYYVPSENVLVEQTCVQ